MTSAAAGLLAVARLQRRLRGLELSLVHALVYASATIIAPMPRYMIVRSFDVGEADMPAVGRRSREIVENELPEITWEHSHVVVDDDGQRAHVLRLRGAERRRSCATTRAGSGQHRIDSIDEIVGDVTPADFPAV